MDQPTPATFDVDSLPPTQYLFLEVLAARHRLGEQHWTFAERCGPAARALERAGLVTLRSGPAPNAFEAKFTDAGRAATLSDDYTPPVLKPVEDVAGSLATTLFDTVRELQRYVQERADEIAAPRVAEAEKRCRATVVSQSHSQNVARQRLDGINVELRRQLAVRDRLVDRYTEWLKEHGINPHTGIKEN
jgi:hypothetical protein